MFSIWSLLQSTGWELRCDDNCVDLIVSREDSTEKIASSMQTCSGGTKRCRFLPPSTGLDWKMLLLLLVMMGGVEGASLEQEWEKIESVKGMCRMRGVCAEIKQGGGKRIVIPCSGFSPPQPLQDVKIKKKLKEFCPMFKEDEELCCDEENAAALFANFEMATQVIGNCPVCMHNFFDLWCRYTCSPRQSEFISRVQNVTAPNVTMIHGMQSLKVEEIPGRGSELVEEIDMYLDSSYIKSIFESCINVKFGASYAMGILCGMPDNCFHESLSEECITTCLTNLGSPSVETTQSVKIKFITDALGRQSISYNVAALRSDEPLQMCHERTPERAPCSCSDCFGSCAPTSSFLRHIEEQWAVRKGISLKEEKRNGTGKKEVDESGEIEVQEGTSFMGVLHRELIVKESPIFGYPWVAVFLFTICIIVAGFIIGLCFAWDSKKRADDNSKEKIKFAGTYWGARDKLDNYQRGGAEWYAKVVAENTFWIGSITVFIVAVVCVIGFPMQQFIKDPIDIWTEPNSRSRIEKTTFEHYFNSIPRYTQVIIRPIQSYNRPFQYGFTNFGPIFQHFVMQQAFELTYELINLKGIQLDPATGKQQELGLKDVCYKMVDEHCFLISPLSYLQNNKALQECTNRVCIPQLDGRLKDMKEERENAGREETTNGQKTIREEGRGSDIVKSGELRERAESLLQIFKKTFPVNGTKTIGPVDDEQPSEEDPFEPFEDISDINLFEDSQDASKRKKREIPAPSQHRGRSKRHTWPIKVAANKSHPHHSDRVYQNWEFENGIGVLKHLVKCIEIPIASSSYLHLECGSQMGGAPVPGNLVFGGWNIPDADMSEVQKIVHYSNAYVITIGLDSKKKELAEIWEKAVIDRLKKYSNEFVEVNFITQSSIQEEIDSASYSDIRIITIGYCLMAIYIVFGLSQFSVSNRKGCFRHTMWYQIFPGFMVSITIGLSVMFVIAVYGIFGLHATLMCLEVQPFLLCAIGVNNVFYFVKTYQRQMHERKQQEASLVSPISVPPTDSLSVRKNGEMSDDESEVGSVQSEEERKEMEVEMAEDLIRREVLTQTCQRVLPSMFCTAFTECCCFLSLGLSSAPVLKVFSFYASAGVLVNFLFTLMIFVPFFFMAMKFSASPSGICSPVDCVPKAKQAMRRRTRYKFDQVRSSRGWMPHLIEKYYAPMIFTRKGRYSSIILQFLLISVAIIFIPQLPIGLDEKMSVPVDSYVHKFMSALPDTLASSMPVHFVVHSKNGKPLNVTDEKFVRLFCTRSDCAGNSLGNLIDEAVKVTKTDLISQPAMNWIDDYRKFRSVSSYGKSCCLVEERGGYCTIEMAQTGRSNCSTCIGRDDDEFRTMTKDLKHFTRLLPTMDCGMSGGMAHREALSFAPDGQVNAFYLRSFHRTFRNSSDFIDGLRLSRLVSEEFKKVLDHNGYDDVQVFPYSFYYLYYDQYLFIALSTSSQLALSAGVAFVGLTITTVSPTTALIVALNTLSATLMLIGYMVWRSIELNALTIVNLAMSLGIDLEFFAHLCFAYANSGRVDRIGRATDALVNVGSTVFSGIIFTKFLGLIVLYNAQSQIFKTYYFDFYLGLLPIGTLHGLLFLPVMLTFWGPDTYLRRYMEQNDKTSLTNGDGQGSEEGRMDSTSSPRSLILLASSVPSKGSSRGASTYGRVAAAISPANVQLTQSNGSNGSPSSVSARKSESPAMATAPSTIDHESAPLVVRVDSLRNNRAQDIV